MRTTPEAIDLQRTFREMLDGGDVACAMEVSSHALELHRADAIHWEVAVFTNLTQDHLDFHPDMDAYFAAKRRLFEAGPRAAVINVDDPYGRTLAADVDAVTIGDRSRRATCAPRDVRFGLDGSTLQRRRARAADPASRALQRAERARRRRGRATARRRRRDDRPRRAAAPGACPGDSNRSTRGRDSRCSSTTPTRPTRWRTSCGPHASSRGAASSACSAPAATATAASGPRWGGSRGELADVPIVTSDNPRSEDPEAIIAEIVAGMDAAPATEPDRRAAIERAVALADEGDVVVIAGKGHEQGQEFAGGRKVPFDDVAVAREALRARLVA